METQCVAKTLQRDRAEGQRSAPRRAGGAPYLLVLQVRGYYGHFPQAL